jgi:PAS domain S-box-containing protein
VSGPGQQQVEERVRERTADLLRINEALRADAARWQQTSAELQRRLQELEADAQTDRAARRAALNLIEDAVMARHAKQIESEERQRSSAALRVSEERFQLALDAAAMGTFLWQVQEDRTECDTQMLALFGLSADRSISLKTALSTMIHEDDRERYAAAVGRAIDPAGHGELREDIRVILPDGAQRWLAVTGQVYFDGEPRQANRMVGGVMDITGRKHIEEALREGEARQAFLLKLSDALRALTDPLEIQAVAARVLGERLNVSRALYAKVVSEEDSDFYIVSQDYHQPEVPSIVGRHRANDFGATLFNEMRAGRTLAVADVAVETRITEQERAAYPTLGIQAYVGVPLIKEGRHVAIFGVLHNTPRAWTSAEIAMVEETAERTWAAVERAQAEVEVREAKAAAELASKGKDRMLAVLSHELRTPLTPVVLLVGAMQEDKSLSEEVQENLAMIRRNVELETKLIDDLLDVTRLGSGKVRLNLRQLDLNETVMQACVICLPLSTERAIKVECEYDGAIGKINADPVRLQQVFWNVLKNAIKFTMKGGRIYVTTTRLSDSRCEVRIRDNGIGIKPEVLSRIFDVFDQGEPAITQRFGGLGLGLSISKSLMELHGGTIRAESSGIGEGASFIMELPSAPRKGGA